MQQSPRNRANSSCSASSWFPSLHPLKSWSLRQTRHTVHARDISTPVDFPCGDSAQEPSQEIGAGDDAPLLSPHEDQIVVDDIIFGMPRFHFHEPDNVAQSRAHVRDDDRAMPIRLRTDRHFIEEDIAQKMVSIPKL